MPFDNPDPWRPDPPPSFLARYATAVLWAILLVVAFAIIAAGWLVGLILLGPLWLGVKITEAAAWCARRLRT
jgi:hypothetical protein